MHVVDCLFVIVSSVLAIILGIIVNALRFLKMLQAAKCVHHRELAFQTLCQSVQNADAVCLARTWGFICSALVAMIHERNQCSSNPEVPYQGQEVHGEGGLLVLQYLVEVPRRQQLVEKLEERRGHAVVLLVLGEDGQDGVAHLVQLAAVHRVEDGEHGGGGGLDEALRHAANAGRQAQHDPLPDDGDNSRLSISVGAID